MKNYLHRTLAVLVAGCIVGNPAAASGASWAASGHPSYSLQASLFQSEALSQRSGVFFTRLNSHPAVKMVGYAVGAVTMAIFGGAVLVTPAPDAQPKKFESKVPEWHPTGPASVNAQAYHASLLDPSREGKWASWHRDAVNTLALSDWGDWQTIRRGMTLVDYAVGTGGSAIPLLRYLKGRGIPITLICIDVQHDWPTQAYELLHKEFGDFHEIRFQPLKDPDPEIKKLHKISDVIAPNSVDRVYSMSTLHLIRADILPGVIKDLYTVLKPGGMIVWASGDVVPPGAPKRTEAITAVSGLPEGTPSLLHDSIRLLRAWMLALMEFPASPPYQSAVSLRNKLLGTPSTAKIPLANAYEDLLKRVNSVFLPVPDTTELLTQSFKDAGFPVGKLGNYTINVSESDWVRFCQVPSLAAYLEEIPVEERDFVIKTILKMNVFPHLFRYPDTPAGYYPTTWVYGKYQKPSTPLPTRDEAGRKEINQSA